MTYFRSRKILACAILSLSSLAVAPLTAFADAAPALPEGFNVYSLGGIHYSGSDFEGNAGASGNVVMDHFSVGLKSLHSSLSLYVGGSASLTEGMIENGGLSVAGNLKMHNAGVQGAINTGGSFDAFGGQASGSVRATHKIHSSYFQAPHLTEGTEYTPPVNQSRLEAGLWAYSAALNSCGVTAEAVCGDGITEFHGNEDGGTNVFHVTTNQIANTWRFVFEGLENEVFVVNIYGSNAKIGDAEVQMIGGVKPENIILHFVDASTLKIAQIDLKATVLAPAATTEFRNALITGDLFVGDLTGNGQTNLGAFTGGLCECGIPSLAGEKCGNR